MGALRCQGLGLIHLNLSAQRSTWHRVAVSDSSQLIKRGTTSPASCETLLRAGAASDRQARLESLQPKDPLCRLSVLKAKPPDGQLPHAHWALALWVSITQPAAKHAQPSLV